jgi:hypothetical protein
VPEVAATDRMAGSRVKSRWQARLEAPLRAASTRRTGSWGTLNLSTQSARHDESVAVVHTVQPQQIAVLAGPHA